jgi:hypothetical protein
VLDVLSDSHLELEDTIDDYLRIFGETSSGILRYEIVEELLALKVANIRISTYEKVRGNSSVRR